MNLRIVTNAILACYAALTLLSTLLYIPRLRQIFYRGNGRERKVASRKRRICVVIPARNESAVIGDILKSVFAQGYDGGYYAVNVIVDNPSDATVQIAKGFGAEVVVVEGQTCKGDALDGFFKAIGREGISLYDAFAVVDADAVLAPDFLTELNNALEYGVQIVVTRKRIKNFLGGRKDRSLYCNCSALTYAQLDDLGNVYRTERGIPVNMCGQGMMVTSDVIAELGGWPYRTLTEDYEMRMDCFLKGFTSMYYPHAVVYTEEPLTHRENYRRRLRWVTGFSQCDRLYKKRIRGQAKERGRANEGEREYFYSLIPLIAFIVNTALAVLSGAALTVYGAVAGDGLYPLLLALSPLAVIYLYLLVYSAKSMAAMKDAFCALPLSARVATVLYEPLYLLEYFPIFVHSRINARKGWDWQPTRHISYGGDRIKLPE